MHKLLLPGAFLALLAPNISHAMEWGSSRWGALWGADILSDPLAVPVFGLGGLALLVTLVALTPLAGRVRALLKRNNP